MRAVVEAAGGGRGLARVARPAVPRNRRIPMYLARPLDQAQPQRIGLARRAAARSGVTRPAVATRSQSRFVGISDNSVPPPPDGTARCSGSTARAGHGGLIGESVWLAA